MSKTKYYDSKKDPLMNPNENIKNWNKNSAGKGSKRRLTDEQKYRDNYDKIFGNKKETEDK
jgi:hypothetical protein